MDIVFFMIVMGGFVAFAGWVGYKIEQAETNHERRHPRREAMRAPAAADHPFEAAGYERELADRTAGPEEYGRVWAAEEEAGRLAVLKAGELGGTGNWRGVASLIKANREEGSNKVNQDLANRILGDRR